MAALSNPLLNASNLHISREAYWLNELEMCMFVIDLTVSITEKGEFRRNWRHEKIHFNGCACSLISRCLFFHCFSVSSWSILDLFNIFHTFLTIFIKLFTGFTKENNFVSIKIDFFFLRVTNKTRSSSWFGFRVTRFSKFSTRL